MICEWDSAKRQENIRKHNVDFEDIPPVFKGTTVTVEDTRFDYDEIRYNTLGLLKGQVVMIAHTDRGDRIRLISARRAIKKEQKYYYEQITN
ncbi:MAG: BrnT family toxin [Chloroflexota bacterium]